MTPTTWSRCVIGLTLALAGAATASPSLRGGTGLINTPNTRISSGTSVAFVNGVSTTHGVWGLGFVEGGFRRTEGDTLYNFKVKFLPELMLLPSAAVGVRGLAEGNGDREFYLSLSKELLFGATVSAGVIRSVSFTEGDRSLFGGLEIPVLGRGRILGEWDGKAGTWNAGLGYHLTRSLYLYHHVLDVRDGGPGGDRNKVYGITWGASF